MRPEPGARRLLLPGLAADARMHAALTARLPDWQALDWGPALGCCSIDAAAEALIAAHRLTAADTVGGSSMGGIVAGRIAELLGSRRLLLLGSALDAREIHPLLRRLLPACRGAPLRLVHRLASLGGRFLLSRMYASVEPEFVRGMCLDLRGWPGYRGEPSIVRRVHGSRDRIILPPAQGAVLIPGAGHLVAMTHPEACAATIARCALSADGAGSPAE